MDDSEHNPFYDPVATQREQQQERDQELDMDASQLRLLSESRHHLKEEDLGPPSDEEQQRRSKTRRSSLSLVEEEFGGRTNEPEALQRQSKTERRKTALIIAAAVMFLFADQNLMAPNLTAIAKDFGFNDEQRDRKLGGEISLAFFLMGAPVSLLVGYCTDLVSRKRLFAAVVFLGELPCLATYFVTTYTQFFWLRALTGIAIGGALPVTFSLLGDLYDSTYRAKVASGLSIAMGGGIMSGQVMAGAVGPEFGWRVPFVIVSVPNLFLSFLVLYLIKEPPRGQMEEALITESGAIEEDQVTVTAYREHINLKKVHGVFSIRTNLLIFAQGLPGTIPWGAITVFLNDYLHTDKGFSVGLSTMFLLMFGIGCFIGALGGGFVGQQVYNRNKHWLPLLMGISSLTGVFPMLYILNAPLGAGTNLFEARHGRDAFEFSLAIIITFLGGILASVPGANIRAILLNVNTPETRGTAFSMFNLMDELGKGLGPLIVSLFIHAMGRTAALNLAMLFWLISGAIQACIGSTINFDVNEMNHSLTTRVHHNGLVDNIADPDLDNSLDHVTRSRFNIEMVALGEQHQLSRGVLNNYEEDAHIPSAVSSSSSYPKSPLTLDGRERELEEEEGTQVIIPHIQQPVVLETGIRGGKRLIGDDDYGLEEDEEEINKLAREQDEVMDTLR